MTPAPNGRPVITVLFYPDVPQAVAWLTTALQFTERLRNSEDRRQLVHGRRDKGWLKRQRAFFSAADASSVSPRSMKYLNEL
jgi:hypothetical protein